MRLRTFKVGGLRFVQIGRLSLSFCITKAAPQPKYEIPLTLTEITLLRLCGMRAKYSRARMAGIKAFDFDPSYRRA